MCVNLKAERCRLLLQAQEKPQAYSLWEGRFSPPRGGEVTLLHNRLLEGRFHRSQHRQTDIWGAREPIYRCRESVSLSTRSRRIARRRTKVPVERSFSFSTNPLRSLGRIVFPFLRWAARRIRNPSFCNSLMRRSTVLVLKFIRFAIIEGRGYGRASYSHQCVVMFNRITTSTASSSRSSGNEIKHPG